MIIRCVYRRHQHCACVLHVPHWGSAGGCLDDVWSPPPSRHPPRAGREPAPPLPPPSVLVLSCSSRGSGWDRARTWSVPVELCDERWLPLLPFKTLRPHHWRYFVISHRMMMTPSISLW